MLYFIGQLGLLLQQLKQQAISSNVGLNLKMFQQEDMTWTDDRQTSNLSNTIVSRWWYLFILFMSLALHIMRRNILVETCSSTKTSTDLRLLVNEPLDLSLHYYKNIGLTPVILEGRIAVEKRATPLEPWLSDRTAESRRWDHLHGMRVARMHFCSFWLPNLRRMVWRIFKMAIVKATAPSRHLRWPKLRQRFLWVSELKTSQQSMEFILTR